MKNMKIVDTRKAQTVMKKVQIDVMKLIKERAKQVDEFAHEHGHKENYDTLKQEELLPALRSGLVEGANGILRTAMEEYFFKASYEAFSFSNVGYLLENKEEIKSKLVESGASEKDVDKMMNIVSEYSKKIEELSSGMDEIATLLVNEDSRLGAQIKIEKCVGIALAVVTAALIGGMVASIGLTAVGVATGASFASFAIPYVVTIGAVGFWPVSVLGTAGLVAVTDSLVGSKRGPNDISSSLDRATDIGHSVYEKSGGIKEKIGELIKGSVSLGAKDLETVHTNMIAVHEDLKNVPAALESAMQPQQQRG